MRLWPLILFILIFSCGVQAQQYNSDSWLSKPHGMVTIIPTWGQRSKMIMNTFSLFPRWEFTYASYSYNDDGDPLTDDGQSSTAYAKYMFYQNDTKDGGASVKAGTGLFPGTIKGDERVSDAQNTYWVNFPCTIPMFNNILSWDIMPGASLTKSYGKEQTDAWGFTYSTRMAYYPLDPEWAIVGEVFGTEGERVAIPEYKLGLRWEPTQHVVYALTYGEEFNGTEGAGIEFGIMLFTPQFACFGKCKN